MMKEYQLNSSPQWLKHGNLKGVSLKQYNWVSCLGKDDRLYVLMYDHQKEHLSNVNSYAMPKSVDFHSWSPDGQWVVLTSHQLCGHQLYLYRWENQDLSLRKEDGLLYYRPTDLSIGGNPKKAYYRLTISGPHGVELYRLQKCDGKLNESSMKLHKNAHVHRIHWSHSGRYLMVGMLTGHVSVWEDDDEEIMQGWHVYINDFQSIADMRMNAAETRMVVCNDDGNIIIYQRNAQKKHEWFLSVKLDWMEGQLNSCSLGSVFLYEPMVFLIHRSGIGRWDESIAKGEEFHDLEPEIRGMTVLGTHVFVVNKDGAVVVFDLDDKKSWSRLIANLHWKASKKVYETEKYCVQLFNDRDHQELMVYEKQQEEEIWRELYRLEPPFYIDDETLEEFRGGSAKWYDDGWLSFFHEGCFYLIRPNNAMEGGCTQQPWISFQTNGKWAAYEWISGQTLKLSLMDQNYQMSVWKNNEYCCDKNQWEKIETRTLISFPKPLSFGL
jgi:hypothetical protein